MWNSRRIHVVPAYQTQFALEGHTVSAAVAMASWRHGYLCPYLTEMESVMHLFVALIGSQVPADLGTEA